jgi:hypothetical protein
LIDCRLIRCQNGSRMSSALAKCCWLKQTNKCKTTGSSNGTNSGVFSTKLHLRLFMCISVVGVQASDVWYKCLLFCASVRCPFSVRSLCIRGNPHRQGSAGEFLKIPLSREKTIKRWSGVPSAVCSHVWAYRTIPFVCPCAPEGHTSTTSSQVQTEILTNKSGSIFKSSTIRVPNNLCFTQRVLWTSRTLEFFDFYHTQFVFIIALV